MCSGGGGGSVAEWLGFDTSNNLMPDSYSPPIVKDIPTKSNALQAGKKLADAKEVKAPTVGDDAIQERAAKKVGAERLTINLGGVNNKKKNNLGIGGVRNV